MTHATATTVGVDLAKNVFQVHGIDETGKKVLQKKLSRAQFMAFLKAQPFCIIAMEACATAHYWGRVARDIGHDVRLIPPSYVKPFVKRHKNDAVDAEAIVEASARPSMHTVAIKTEDQQSRSALFRTRELFVRQRTQLINALRAHLMEFGVPLRKGTRSASRLVEGVDDVLSELPHLMQKLAKEYSDQITRLSQRIMVIEKEIKTNLRKDKEAVRMQTMPGVGPMTASALQAFCPPLDTFSSGRDFAAWLGLVPRQHSTGGKSRLGKITKMGQRDVRRLLVIGAMSVLAANQRKGSCDDPWLVRMIERRPRMVVATALANRMARRLWAMLTKQQDYEIRGVVV